MKRVLQTILRFTPLIAILLGVLQLVVSNELAAFGSKVRTIETQIDLVRSENERLAWQVASATSLMNVNEKAISLGFIDNISAPTVISTEHRVALETVRP